MALNLEEMHQFLRTVYQKLGLQVNSRKYRGHLVRVRVQASIHRYLRAVVSLCLFWASTA